MHLSSVSLCTGCDKMQKKRNKRFQKADAQSDVSLRRGIRSAQGQRKAEGREPKSCFAKVCRTLPDLTSFVITFVAAVNFK